MFSRTAGGSAAAAAPAGLCSNAPGGNANEPLGTAFPGVALVNFRRRTVHAPGQLDDSGALPALSAQHDEPYYSSSAAGSALQAGSFTSRAASASGTPYSRLATKSSLPQFHSVSSLHWDTNSQAGTVANSMMVHAAASVAGTIHWDAVSQAGTVAHSTKVHAAASVAATPTAASASSSPSTCSTPNSPKRHSNKPKWLQNVLKYTNPKGRPPRSRQSEAQLKEREGVPAQQQYSQQQVQDMQHQQLMRQEQQAQLQMQLELAEQEELAFQQQFFEQGWDKLPEHIQLQLKEQFHAEFLLQLQEQDHLQQELQQLQAAYPDLDPALLQEQLLQQYMQAQEQQLSSAAQYEQQAQFGMATDVPDAANVYEQHMQYEALQQQLAGLQLPEHVQWMIQQHQQQQPGEGDAQAQTLQTQEFVYSAAAAVVGSTIRTEGEGDSAGEQQAPLVHVLDGPNGQVVQVTPDEFQDILTVMQALADARRDLAVRLQPSGGGQSSTGTQGCAQPDPAAAAAGADSTQQGTLPEQDCQQDAYAAAAGSYGQDPDAAAGEVDYQVLRISAGADFSAQGAQHACSLQEAADSQAPQDMDGQQLLQDQARSKATDGRLQQGPPRRDGGLGVVDGLRASSGGRRRPVSATVIKQTLFDFSAVTPTHAEVHYLRASDQEGLRIKARPVSSQGFPASPTSVARCNMHRSMPGSLPGSEGGSPQKSGAKLSLFSWSRNADRPKSVLPGSVPSTPLSTKRPGSDVATSLAAEDASSRGRMSVSSTLFVGRVRTSTKGRARSASPRRTSIASDETMRESAKVALQKYRAAFELMRLRDKSQSCSGWTDDDSPTKVKQTPFSKDGAENERAIERLTKKVAELEAGLAALLSGQAIPPAAAAGLIAAISQMRLPGSKPGSLGGILSKGGAAGSGGGLALSAGGVESRGGLQVQVNAAGTQAKLKVQAAQQQAAEDLDSVIQAINQAQSQYQPPAQHKRRQQQQQVPEVVQQQHSGDSHSGGTWQSADTAFGGAPPAPRSKAPASATQQSPKCQEEGTEGSMGEEELQRATAAYDAGKAEAHKQKVQQDMARRAADANYDSDLEEEEQQEAAQQQQREQEAAGGEEAAAAMKVLAETEKKLKELQEQEERLKAMWAEQEECMSSYRRGSRAGSPQADQPAEPVQHPDSSQGYEAQQPPQQHRSRPSSRQCSVPHQLAVEEANKGAQAKQQVQAEAAAAAAVSRGLQAAQQTAAAAAATAAKVPATEVADTSASAQGRHRSSTGKSRSSKAAGLSPAAEAAVMQRFVPTMSDEFPEFAAVADAIAAGDLAAETSARMLGLMPPRAGEEQEYGAMSAGYASGGGRKPRKHKQHQHQHSRQRSQSSTGDMVSGAYEEITSSSGGGSGVEERPVQAQEAHSRSSKGHRKSIAAVKLEQDLEIKACEEAAMYHHRFVANAVPRTTRELRYHQMMAEQHTKRAATHQKYLQLLASQQQPSTFAQEDAEAAAAKASQRAAALDPNRFQRPFKAKAVPSHVYEHRLEGVMAAQEAAKLAAKVKAEMAKERVQKTREEERLQRSVKAASLYQEHLTASIKPIKTASTASSSCPTTSRDKPTAPGPTHKPSSRHSQANGPSAGGGSSSAGGLPFAPQQGRQAQPHPFAQADAADSELRGEFPVLHSTYSTEGGSSACSGQWQHLEGSGSNATPLASHQAGGWGSESPTASGRRASEGVRPPVKGGGRGSKVADVPDYKALHERWEAAQAAKKAANTKRRTVPEPPSFCSTTGEDEARAAERRARIQQDMQEDEQRLAEQRWPFTGPRVAVKASPSPRDSTHPKGQRGRHSRRSNTGSGSGGRQSGSGWSDSASEGDVGSPMLQRPPRPISASRPMVKETAAALLRAQATKQAMLEGKYDTQEERERKAQEAERREQEEQKAQKAAADAACTSKKQQMKDERSKLLQQLHAMKAQDAAAGLSSSSLSKQQQYAARAPSRAASPSRPSSAAGTAAPYASAGAASSAAGTVAPYASASGAAGTVVPHPAASAASSAAGTAVQYTAAGSAAGSPALQVAAGTVILLTTAGRAVMQTAVSPTMQPVDHSSAVQAAAVSRVQPQPPAAADSVPMLPLSAVQPAAAAAAAAVAVGAAAAPAAPAAPRVAGAATATPSTPGAAAAAAEGSSGAAAAAGLAPAAVPAAGTAAPAATRVSATVAAASAGAAAAAALATPTSLAAAGISSPPASDTAAAAGMPDVQAAGSAAAGTAATAVKAEGSRALQAARAPTVQVARAAAAPTAAGADTSQVQQQGGSSAIMPTAAEVAAHLHRMLSKDVMSVAAAEADAASRALANAADGLAKNISTSAAAASAAATASAAAAAAAVAAAGAAEAVAASAAGVAAASEQQQHVLGAETRHPSAAQLMVMETLGMCMDSPGCTTITEMSPRNGKMIPPMAAPTKAPSVVPVQRSPSPGSTVSPIKPLPPSVLFQSDTRGSRPGSASGSRRASRASSGGVLASAELALEAAAAALSAERQSSKSTAAAESAATATTAHIVVASPAAAEAQDMGAEAPSRQSQTPTAGTAAHYYSQRSATAEQRSPGSKSPASAPAASRQEPDSWSSSSRSPAVQQQDEAQQQQQQQQQAQPAQGQQLRPCKSSSSNGSCQLRPLQPEVAMVQVAPSFLSVKARVKAINAAGRISPASSMNGSIGPMLSQPSIDSEASGSYKPCHSWGRSMGLATSSFSNNGASWAHVNLIDQLNMSQVGTMVERSTVERRRAPIAQRQDAPLMHIEARHAQAEKKAREIVDEALREHGLRGYKAFEEEDSP